VLEGSLPVDIVPVAPAQKGEVDIARGDEVGDDALRGAQRDAHLRRDVLEPSVVIAVDAHEHVRVVGGE
jgi:hypothetical protein